MPGIKACDLKINIMSTQKASNEDSSSDTDNDDVILDMNKNAFDLIKEYCLKNRNNVILAHLNIDFIRNKFLFT